MNKNGLHHQMSGFSHDPIFRWSAFTTIPSLIWCAGLLLVLWKKLPPLVPLFYSLPWGEAQLSSPFILVLFLVILTIAYCFNYLLAFLLYGRHVYFARILAIGAAFITILGVFSITQIVFLIS